MADKRLVEEGMAGAGCASAARWENYFLLPVKDNSMINARICEGDRVLVKKQNWLENGDIGVVMVGREEATIKRYYEQDGLVILKPENPAYSPQVYKPDEVIVLGRVMETWIDVEKLLKSPAVLPALRRRLENPEKWAAYRNMTLEKVAEVAIEAGYDSPEVIALGYKTLKTVAELSEEQAQELIAALGG